jgi:RNA polymerase sigma-70 factor (sigma-E family)
VKDVENVTADAPGQVREQVSELYVQHALGLVRLAVVMLGDRAGAEDVVQDAFLGLYRRWENLTDPAKALAYVRSCVLNGCRTVLRQRDRGRRLLDEPVLGAPADEGVLLSEEHAQVLAAIRRLPDRQREAVVLRFYLDMDEAQAAAAMGVSRGTVKSATSRAVAALGRILHEGASS